MATMTDAELRYDCGVALGLVKEGDSALENDWDLWLVKKSRQVRAFLVSRELMWWPTDAIPDDVSLGLTWLVASAAAEKWGKDYDKTAAGLEIISEVGAKRPAGEHTRAKYF